MTSSETFRTPKQQLQQHQQEPKEQKTETEGSGKGSRTKEQGTEETKYKPQQCQQIPTTSSCHEERTRQAAEKEVEELRKRLAESQKAAGALGEF